MRYFLPAVLCLIFSGLAVAQTPTAPPKPLSQSEYVRMLYDLQKNPGRVSELVEAVRTRGIDFELTDGLRGLTTSKSRSNPELKRTIEEAARRRQNPTEVNLPSAAEASAILAKAREANLTAVEEMPDFVVKQLISRSEAYARTNNWKSRDNLTVAVSYSADKGEQYRLLAINGTPADAVQSKSYGGVGGATTVGEFVENLNRVFKPESRTDFQLVDTDLIRGSKTLIYAFKIELANSKNDGVSYSDTVTSRVSVPTGRKGKVWIDRENFRVMRIEFEMTDIPASFPIKAFEGAVDYDWVTISDQKYLLPTVSDGRFTVTVDGALIQTRNLIRFRNYQKYGTEIRILDSDDEEPPAEEKKPEPK